MSEKPIKAIITTTKIGKQYEFGREKWFSMKCNYNPVWILSSTHWMTWIKIAHQ